METDAYPETLSELRVYRWRGGRRLEQARGLSTQFEQSFNGGSTVRHRPGQGSASTLQVTVQPDGLSLY